MRKLSYGRGRRTGSLNNTARISVLMGGLAASSSGALGCLVTDTPRFDPPTPTAPYFTGSGASPDPEQIVWFDDQGHPALLASETLPFSAYVTSQDDPNSEPAFANVVPRLYVDYGTGTAEQPFVAKYDGNPAPPNTLGQSLLVSVDFPPFDPELQGLRGCHTITLMVSHAFTGSPPDCPKYCGDFSATTWIALFCDSTSTDAGADECDVLNPDTCPTPEYACPTTPKLSKPGAVAADAGPTCSVPSAGVP